MTQGSSRCWRSSRSHHVSSPNRQLSPPSDLCGGGPLQGVQGQPQLHRPPESPPQARDSQGAAYCAGASWCAAQGTHRPGREPLSGEAGLCEWATEVARHLPRAKARLQCACSPCRESWTSLHRLAGCEGIFCKGTPGSPDDCKLGVPAYGQSKW